MKCFHIKKKNQSKILHIQWDDVAVVDEILLLSSFHNICGLSFKIYIFKLIKLINN